MPRVIAPLLLLLLAGTAEAQAGLRSVRASSLEPDDQVPAPPTSAPEVREYGFGERATRWSTADGRRVWIRYARPSGVSPRLEFLQLAPRLELASGDRVLSLSARFGAGDMEHAGFALVRAGAAAEALWLDPGADPVTLRLHRAPAVRGERRLSDERALALAPRLVLSRNCRGGVPRDGLDQAPHRSQEQRSCLVFGTPAELDALLSSGRAPARPDDWRLAPWPAPGFDPLPLRDESETLAQRAFGAERYLLRRAHVAAERERRYSVWLVLLREGAAPRTTHLFSYALSSTYADGASDPDPVVGDLARLPDGRLFAWAWDPDAVGAHAVFIDPESGQPLHALQARNVAPTDDIDCGNVFSDTRPVAVLVDDVLHVALTWSGSSRALLFPRLGRPGRFVALHLPNELAFGDAEEQAPLYRLRGPLRSPGAYLEPLVESPR